MLALSGLPQSEPPLARRKSGETPGDDGDGGDGDDDDDNHELMNLPQHSPICQSILNIYLQIKPSLANV